MIKIICSMVLIAITSSSYSQTPNTVFLEELTWTEVRAAIDSGTTTIIVPTAGTEQNGPHMAIGKHKYRINAASERIAREIGHTLVAPVMTYVPEGSIDPPSEHMQHAGTISIPQDVFRSVLEYAARSLKSHGFTDILFIGDSGPNQQGMSQVSEELNEEWRNERARVLFISEWFSNKRFFNWLKSQGISEETIGVHAGLLDTSLLLAVAPQHVRVGIMAPGRGKDIDGVAGDPTGATAELGKIGYDMNFNAAVKQIRELMAKE